MNIRTSFLQHVPGVLRHYRYLLPLMPRAVESFELPVDADVIVSFSHAVAKSVIPPRCVPHVCYCFTPMRYAWHLRGDYFERQRDGQRYGVFSGKTLRKPLDAARDFLLNRIRDWDRRTAERVTEFAAVSQTVAERIQECYGRDSTVIYPPVDTDFYTPADVPREEFYLCVSALVPYKRIDLAIEACKTLGRRLIVIGDGPELQTLRREAGENITFMGWQPDEVIRDHYRRCRALLFPGREDFGIVPVEAQACGTPVIALARGGALETVIDGETGVLFESPTAEGLAGALDRLSRLEVDRERLRCHAQRFSRDRHVAAMRAVIDETLAAPADTQW
jgi:glycosyltransferase involved in cell wall biosynthesis